MTAGKDTAIGSLLGSYAAAISAADWTVQSGAAINGDKSGFDWCHRLSVPSLCWAYEARLAETVKRWVGFSALALSGPPRVDFWSSNFRYSTTEGLKEKLC